MILRGGSEGPNDDAETIRDTSAALKKQNLPHRIMIDCSHGNSHKDYTCQPTVAARAAEKLAAGEKNIFGVMLESHLVAGRQEAVVGKPLVYGQSITDSCMGWDDTVRVLETLAAAAAQHR